MPRLLRTVTSVLYSRVDREVNRYRVDGLTHSRNSEALLLQTRHRVSARDLPMQVTAGCESSDTNADRIANIAIRIAVA